MEDWFVIEEDESTKPWYVLDEDELNDMKHVLLNRFKKRYDVLKSLSLANPTSLEDFENFFSEDDPRLCDIIDKDNSLFSIKFRASGAVGNVFGITKGDINVVLKQIKKAKKSKFIVETTIITDANKQKLYDMTPSVKYYNTVDQNNNTISASVGSTTDFMNQTMMHSILNIILGDNPNYVHQYDAYWCKDGGYNITEWAVNGEMHNYFTNRSVELNDIFDAISQIAASLAILKDDRYSFLHADLKARNVFVGVDSNKNPVFKLADFDKSSITWNGYRFWNDSLSKDTSDLIKFKSVKNGKYKSSSQYVLIGSTMHSKYGYFMSYDVYTFMLSLLAIPEVANWVKNNTNNKVTKLYRYLFEDQMETLISTLYDQGGDLFVSMSKIAGYIASKGLEFKHDIDEFYRMCNVNPPIRRQMNLPQKIIRSYNNYLCEGDCVKGKCKVHAYHKLGWLGYSLEHSDSCTI